MRAEVRCGDARDVLAALDDASVDAVVTDPPYALTDRKGGSKGFMGAAWDHGQVAHDPAFWAEVRRVAKPGAHLVAFGGTRTAHRLACAIEDAGWEIRDSLYWLYGQGFPKSLDVSKAIDRARGDDCRPVCRFLAAHMGAWRITDIVRAMGFAGDGDHGVSAWFREDHVGPRVPTWDQWLRLQDLLGFGDEMDAEVWRLNGRKGTPGEAWHERAVVGHGHRDGGPPQPMWGDGDGRDWDITTPATASAQQWDGWGTALKPAVEPIVLARKPLAEPTVAANVLAHGTGALHIDACRVATGEIGAPRAYEPRQDREQWRITGGSNGSGATSPAGRWPPNLLLSHHPDCQPAGVRRVRGSSRADRGAPTNAIPGTALLGSVHGALNAVQSPGYADAEGYEAVDAWTCHPQCPIRLLDEQAGPRTSRNSTAGVHTQDIGYHGHGSGSAHPGYHGEEGGPSRFFPTFGGPDPQDAVPFRYEPKAPARERRLADGTPTGHPTQKPVALACWLATLVCAPGGTVLDPFAGVGSLGIGALRAGCHYLGIEQDAGYARVAQQRLDEEQEQRSGPLFAATMQG